MLATELSSRGGPTSPTMTAITTTTIKPSAGRITPPTVNGTGVSQRSISPTEALSQELAMQSLWKTSPYGPAFCTPVMMSPQFSPAVACATTRPLVHFPHAIEGLGPSPLALMDHYSRMIHSRAIAARSWYDLEQQHQKALVAALHNGSVAATTSKHYPIKKASGTGAKYTLVRPRLMTMGVAVNNKRNNGMVGSSKIKALKPPPPLPKAKSGQKITTSNHNKK